MKAIVIHGAKDLRIEEQDAPSPGDGEVEIAIKAGGICGSDLHYYNHGGFGAIRVREPTSSTRCWSGPNPSVLTGKSMSPAISTKLKNTPAAKVISM